MSSVIAQPHSPGGAAHSRVDAASDDALMVPCNLCGSDDFKVLFRAGEAQISQVVRCNRCGLMYANPRGRVPDHESIERFDPNWNLVEKDKMKFEKQRLQVRDYEKTRKLLGSLCPRRGRLVEVGSGLGFLLKYFKDDGWDVLGVEPFAEGCSHSETAFGIKAIASILETAGLESASVDALLMMHVIEHVPDPLSTLREINRVLKPRGYFVMETPRYDSLVFKLLGKRERSLRCDGHIYFFTTDTLRRAYELAGFSLVQLDYVGRSLTLERLLWNVAVVAHSKRSPDQIAELARKLHLNDIRLHINVRDMQRVVLQKI